jgi:hypothetical protein
MEHGFYHPVNGYWQTISTPTDEHLAAYTEGTIEVPIRPSPLHTWGGSEWVPPTQEVADADAAMVARATRSTILVNTVDPLVSNPLRWADMTAEKQAEWAAYRRALLDISQQSGFPHDVVWPVAPEGV